MTPESQFEELIEDVCRDAADPGLAATGLLRLLEEVEDPAPFVPWLGEAARLFGASQFLANFCVQHPEELLSALREVRRPLVPETLSGRAAEELAMGGDADQKEAMRLLRLFKKRCLLRITLRDLAGEADIITSMQELTYLAECTIQAALRYCLEVQARRFGVPPSGGRMALIGLGKLGGEEINYSSDVDLVAVYADEDEETETAGAGGPLRNVISSHEFYCKAVELMNRVLSANTEDGVAFRVDLRLRPQGQRGEIALPLSACGQYYRNWARTWERMAFIRARPVAGDAELGREFMKLIEPFVWRETQDYSEIEEIRSLKKKIDSTVFKNDIKRGYGGIREAEFFVQTFQLIYGAEHGSLRTHRLFNAIQGLRWMDMVPAGELNGLWENYLYLRRLEHYLQMRDDLQTHTVPDAAEELIPLARSMGHASEGEFLTDLRVRRMQIKNMYNSLLGTAGDIHAEALAILEGEVGDEELLGYLAFRGVGDPGAGLAALKGIMGRVWDFKTMRERASVRKVVPVLLEDALRSESPGRALAGIESFFEALGVREAYLSALADKKELREGMVGMFALSSLLTRRFLSTSRYLNVLIEEMHIRKTLRRTEQELARRVSASRGFQRTLALYRGLEEIRLGMFFLMGILSESDLNRYLSHVAEAVVRAALERADAGGLAVVAMGKLGGREITFGSDLDLIFVSSGAGGIRAAEQVIKTLTSYTERGVPYSVDARLRPDGTKGPLVNDVEGYRNYYLEKAHGWEIQALLKARPLGGDRGLERSFGQMAREAVVARGGEVKRRDIRDMRKRIVQELAREDRGLDIKLGPGGIGEIEFHVQGLQLKHAGKHPEVLVQSTEAALRRLAGAGAIGKRSAAALGEAYAYYRKLEAFLRLNGESVFGAEEEISSLAASFMGAASPEELRGRLEETRRKVLTVVKG